MSFKLKYGDLNNSKFTEALTTLSKQQFEFKTAYNITKILRRVTQIQQQALPKYKILVDQFLEKDEKGNPVSINKTDASGAPLFKIKDDKRDEYKAAIEDFMNTEFELDCHKIYSKHLENRAISPDVLYQLMDADLITDEEPSHLSVIK